MSEYLPNDFGLEFDLNVWYLCISVYGINSILYQRGIYPPETFKRVQKYGLTLFVSTEDDLRKYLSEVLTQLKGKLSFHGVMKLGALYNTLLQGGGGEQTGKINQQRLKKGTALPSFLRIIGRCSDSETNNHLKFSCRLLYLADFWY